MCIIFNIILIAAILNFRSRPYKYLH